METKIVRETGTNYTLSVDFISLYYDPEVRWFRIIDDHTGERAQNSKLNSVSYNVTKDNVTFNIPSYGYVFLYSSPELKAEMSFSDHLSSVVCLSARMSVCKLFTFSSSPEPMGRFQTLWTGI